jgi:hypothetical protein
MTPADYAYSTVNEIAFLNNMVKEKSVTEAKGLLKGYLLAAEKRRRWGKVDSDEAVAHAQKLLETTIKETIEISAPYVRQPFSVPYREEARAS